MAVASLLAPAAPGTERSTPRLLAEGTVLSAVNGRLIADDANDLWRFELSDDVNDVRMRIAAGTRFTLLPSAVLESLIVDVRGRQAARYKLSATVTRYRGENFLFASRFLPLSKLKGTEAIGADPNAPGGDENVGAGGDEPALAMAIPPEVLAKLQSRQAAGTEPRTQSGQEAGTPRRAAMGRVMVDRVGLVRMFETGPCFIPYALGWNVSPRRYELLPCSTLERVLEQQAALPEPVRVNIMGLVTEFKGKHYLLLQRAIRAYSYRNLDR